MRVKAAVAILCQDERVFESDENFWSRHCLILVSHKTKTWRLISYGMYEAKYGHARDNTRPGNTYMKRL